MSTVTPACELFREIREIDSMILDMIASQKMAMWHWPSYYLLYVDVDRLWWLLGSAAESIAHPIADTDDLSLGEHIALVNQDFSMVEKQQNLIVSWLWQLSRNLIVEKGELKRRMRAHIHPKSAWYQTFRERYCAGRISSDGKTLTRTILLLDPDAQDRIRDLSESRLVQEQIFDLSTEQSRHDLRKMASTTQCLHAEVQSAMMDFFVQHCTIEALAHPSSI